MVKIIFFPNKCKESKTVYRTEVELRMTQEWREVMARGIGKEGTIFFL